MIGREIMVILCQVPPGFTRGLHVRQAARLYYQVETLVFGLARDPQLSGTSSVAPPLTNRLMRAIRFCRAPRCRCVMKAPSLKNFDQHVPCGFGYGCKYAPPSSENIGADWSEIAPALKLDRRIGQYSDPTRTSTGGQSERDLATVERLAARIDRRIHCACLDPHTVGRAHHSHRSTRFKTGRQDCGVGPCLQRDTYSNSPSLATIAQLKGARVQAPILRLRLALSSAN